MVKHSGGRKAHIAVSGGDGRLRIAVEDDGKGFRQPAHNATHFAPGAGLGLFGIRERIGDLGGTVQVESDPGVRTTVTIDVPTADMTTSRPPPAS